MKFLLDQNVYASTGKFLISLGHDVITVAQIGLARAEDEELLQMAVEQDCLLVTRDRDFDGLVFVKGLGAGVLYIRVLPSTQDVVHAEQDLKASFTVIGADGHRIRRLTSR